MEDVLAARPDTLHTLRAGGFAVHVTPTGGGYAEQDGLALTRHTPDATTGGDGPLVFVRDLDRHAVWTLPHAAGSAAPEGCDARFDDEAATFRRRDGDVTTTLAVSAADACEIRHLAIHNGGTAVRRFDVTTFYEAALNTLAADHAHPAFSKIFVQTARHGDALLAERRLRSPDDRPLALAHTLSADGDGPDGDVQAETDRMRFVGRGRTRATPRALDADAALSGTTGAVLDPVLALRRTVAVGPGETVRLVARLAAGPTRAAARAALGAPAPPLPGLGPVPDAPADPPRARPASEAWAMDESAPVDPGPLRFDNGYGGFREDGKAYVVRVVPGRLLPPLPWTNVLATETAGCLVSERSLGPSWHANSRENRLTPWSNDPVVDPPGEAVWLRDDDAGVFWNVLPGVHALPAPHLVTHAFGHTTWAAAGHGLRQRVRRFAAHGTTATVTEVEVTNTGDAPRRLTAFAYARLVLGGLAHETRPHLSVRADGHALLATNPHRGVFSGGTAFSRLFCDAPHEASATADRTAFVGRGGTETAPCALSHQDRLDGQTDGRGEDGFDPCFAHAAAFTLAPGQTATLAWVLGETDADADAALDALATPPARADAFARTHAFWKDVTEAVQVETPSEPLNLMLSGWLAYQNLACRLFARSAFYQSGGAFGYRDQLQDAAMFALTEPDRLRQQILLHAAHQFPEGDVLHWWHTPGARGIRTRFADDLLWLPYLTAHYLRTTGDHALLDAPAGFVDAPRLDEGEDERFVEATGTDETASVYEHAARAIDRSLPAGAHGLPLIGVGDWNDGMNRVGREGRGESVWMGFFLYAILEDWAEIAARRGDDARAERYAARRAALYDALNADGQGWDGAWYRRAYYDDGTPLGSQQSDECQIDALAQAWAVLSKAAPPDRADQALDALDARLVDEEAGIIRLLTPAFDQTPHDPGYIKGYLPGVRENGGQYTHGVLWAVRAFAEAGRCERAAPLLEMLTPVAHTATRQGADTYLGEPYVVAADVYGVAPHVGRAGWTWYTGSAGWMQRVGVESILGIAREGDRIAAAPCVPAAWDGFRATLRLSGGRTVRIAATRGADGRLVTTIDG